MGLDEALLLMADERQLYGQLDAARERMLEEGGIPDGHGYLQDEDDWD